MKSWLLLLLSAMGLVAAKPPAASTCDTPVYRYAMYNWQPAPYHVFFFHKGQIAKEDEAINKCINDLSEAAPSAANVALSTVDVDDAAQLEQLPDRVRKAWESTGKKELPRHVLFTSWGGELGVERLNQDAVSQLVDSPVRKQIAGLLRDGHAAVFMLMSGPEPKQNEAVEKVVRDLIADVHSGKALGEEEPSVGSKEGDNGPQPPKFKLAMVKFDRNDPAERWLLRSLATIEEEMPEAKNQPLVFTAYARGRVLPPCIGKGITAENLLQDVSLLTGPCSCMIKEQNPGVDLLFRWDWDSTAQRWAQEDEKLAEGGPQRAAMDEPGEMTTTNVEAAQPKSLSQNVAQAAAESSSSPPEKPKEKKPEPEVGIHADVAPLTDAKPLPPVEVNETAADPPQSTARSIRWMWRFGIGLVVAAVIVVAAGRLLTRGRRE